MSMQMQRSDDAGLFSAVNSTLIVGMPPNPGDTTNALLPRLIQITVNRSNFAPDISNLSSSTGYSSSTAWMQTLAYASLAFSVLVAFGGKQWLDSYKAARGRGTLEERGKERQIKPDGLENFHLRTVLQAFLVLLSIPFWLVPQRQYVDPAIHDIQCHLHHSFRHSLLRRHYSRVSHASAQYFLDSRIRAH
ncbi:hypothetical protein BDR05DRAFT_544480 [Suillus weaverae]|nr:hypothetical protein BDR05DRAFT_544480 [Suillus weaverae]